MPTWARTEIHAKFTRQGVDLGPGGARKDPTLTLTSKGQCCNGHGG